MDASTATFYVKRAAACAAMYDGAQVESLHTILLSLASSGSRVLEIGGGSGRDAAFMAELGCDVTYTDGCREMVDQATRLHPALASKARIAAFPLSADDDLLRKRFDLILCIAMIMHLEDASLERFASQLATLVPTEGRLVLSHSCGHQGLIDDRDASGRLYRERPVATVDRVFESLGFQVKQQISDADGMGRQDICWTTQVFQKTA